MISEGKATAARARMRRVTKTGRLVLRPQILVIDEAGHAGPLLGAGG